MHYLHKICLLTGSVIVFILLSSVTFVHAAGTTASITLLLHGIGKGGDSSNVSSGGTATPLRTQRQVSIDIYNASNQLVQTVTSTVTFAPLAGNFAGTVDLSALSNGVYTLRMKVPQYLKRTVSGIISITAGQPVTLPVVTLITGDVNSDNALSILDYNILLDCFSDLGPAKNCADTTKKQMSDLTDDGSVNQFDYNLFLRELSVQSGDGGGVTPSVAVSPTGPPVSPSPLPTGGQVSYPTKYYFVATNGSDTNAGTSTAPFKTVTKALSVTQPGEGIMIKSGTYTEKVKITGKNGTPSAPIIIIGESKDTALYPVFDGGDVGYTASDSPVFDVTGSSWLVFERLSIKNSTSASIRLLDSPYIVVRRLKMDYHKYGVYAKGHSHHFLMEYTECYQSYPTSSAWTNLKGSKWEGGCYWPSGNSGMNIIRFNYMHNQFNAISMVNNGSSAGYVNANTWMYSNRFEKIMDDPYEPETVAFNQHFFDNTLVDTHRMVSIAPPATAGFLGPVYVYNNSMITRFDITKESRHNTAVKADMTVFPANGFYFFNNSVDVSAAGLNGSGVDLLVNTLHNYFQYNNAFKTEINIYRGTPSFVSSESDYNVSSKSFQVTEAHGIASTDPGFANSGGEDFHLTSTSAARGKSRSIAPPIGFGGQTVIQQGADVGAYQFGEAALRKSPAPSYVIPPGGEDPTFGSTNLPWPPDQFGGTNPPSGPK